MPNGNEEDLDELGQDYRPPDQPPIGPVAPPPTQLPPTVAPAVRPPGVPIPPEAMVGGIMSRLATQYRNEQLPMETAQRAVSAALKFQAIRGYQQDINAGMSTADALAKWAPMMFTSQGAGTLGQAAQMVHYARPTVQRPINVGGVAYHWDPTTGTMTGLTPGRPAAQPRVNPLDAQEFRQNLTEISGLQKELDAEPSGPEADDKRNKINYIRQRNREIYAKSQAPAAPAAPAPAIPPRPAVAAPGARPAAPVAAPARAATPKVTSKADYDRLPSGTIYIGKDGRRYRKP